MLKLPRTITSHLPNIMVIVYDWPWIYGIVRILGERIRQGQYKVVQAVSWFIIPTDVSSINPGDPSEIGQICANLAYVGTTLHDSTCSFMSTDYIKSLLSIAILIH